MKLASLKKPYVALPPIASWRLWCRVFDCVVQCFVWHSDVGLNKVRGDLPAADCCNPTSLVGRMHTLTDRTAEVSALKLSPNMPHNFFFKLIYSPVFLVELIKIGLY